MKKSVRAPRRSRAEWRVLVEGWRRSGMSMKAFAAERGVSVNCLSYWSSTLQREARLDRSTRLLPVKVTPSEEPSPGLLLMVGPLRLRFEGGTSPTYIAAVARALVSPS